MGRFTAAEATEYRQLCDACYRYLSTPDLLALVSRRLQSFLGADAFCANELDPGSALLTRAVSEGWPDEAKQLLVEKVFLRSPAADPPGFLKAGWRAVDVDSLVTHLKAPLRDPYFEHHLLPFGYRYEAMTLCTLNGSGHAILTFSRKPSRGRHEERRIRLLQTLAPHVAVGVARGNLREVLAARADHGLGVLVLDDGGHLEVANPLAEDWLRSDPTGRWSLGLPLVVGLLLRNASPRTKRTNASGQDHLPPPFIELPHPGTGAPYRAFWERGAGSDGSPRTVIFLEPIRRLDSPETLRRLGLTQRESDVTMALVRGMSAKEAAEHLRLSLHTVNQHTKSVFTRLGVSSRVQLAVLLMGAGRGAGRPVNPSAH